MVLKTMTFVIWLWTMSCCALPTIVHFRHALTPAFIRHVEAIVQYECTEYVPHDGLLLYLTQNLQDDLVHHLGHVIRSVEPLQVTEMCSPHLHALSTSSSSSTAQQPTRFSERIYLNGTVVTPLVSPVELSQHSVHIRLLIHPGAFVYVASLQEISQTLTSHIHTRYPNVHVSAQEPDIIILSNVENHMDVAEHVLSIRPNPICWVEPVLPAHTVNVWSSATAQHMDGMSHSNVNSALQCIGGQVCSPLWDAGLQGQGQIIAISDTGLSVGACHFRDSSTSVPHTSSNTLVSDNGHRSVRAYWTYGDSSDSDGHGTHVCGTAAGRAATGVGGGDSTLSAADFNGVAPHARIVMIDIQRGSGGIDIPSPYDTQLLDFAYKNGARIHSGSWGIADYIYSDEDRRVDLFAWNHRTFTSVFAAGNSGDEDGAASILSPALAKNVVAVGAALPGFAPFDLASSSNPTSPIDAYNYDWVAEFSSRGGSQMDGQWMKPNLLGSGGRYVWSSNADNTGSCNTIGNVVVGMGGTSMAAPQIAGSIAIIRQYFLAGRYTLQSFEPMSSLVKCILAASAHTTRGIFNRQSYSTIDASSLYSPYKRQFVEGHGRISLQDALPLASSTTALAILSNENANSAFSQSQQTRVYCLQLQGEGSGSVRIALAWTDYPTSLTANAALVNDLDVSVRVNNGPILYPNNLQRRDSLSTLELIRLQNVELPANIHVTVVSHRISFSIQEYSLVAVATSSQSSLSWLLHGAAIPVPDQITFTNSCPNSSPIPVPPPISPTPNPTSFTNTPNPTPNPTSAENTPNPTSAENTPNPTSAENTPNPTSAESTPNPTITPQPTPIPPNSPPSHLPGSTCNGRGSYISQECICLPGWAGSNCDNCAIAPPGTTYMCIGLQDVNQPIGPVETHVLALVDSTSISARLSGSYYTSHQQKYPDTFPGASNKDCWCQVSPLDANAFSTHGQALTAAIRHQEKMLSHIGSGYPSNAIVSPPGPSPTPMPTQVVTPRPTAPSGANVYTLNVAVSLLSIYVLL